MGLENRTAGGAAPGAEPDPLREALDLACRSAREGGGPFGAVIALGVLGTTAATTLRSFVFEPRLGVAAWTAGASITLLAAAIGTALALLAPMRRSVSELMETR